jgi:hypothetical protein
MGPGTPLAKRKKSVFLLIFPFEIKNENPIKSRHPGESRGPVRSWVLQNPESGFRRNDGNTFVATFCRSIKNLPLLLKRISAGREFEELKDHAFFHNFTIFSYLSELGGLGGIREKR